MLLYKPRTLRLIASWLLVQTSTQLVWPTVSYALTAGPTAPEATSFEPVDTTDMVNLNSGDLTYNIPLLEVPGPEGGYPLSLSYHAGIQPNEEASWVGLGWSLNPGAISRSVNGYADDHQEASMVRRDFWAGGRTSTYTVGLNVGAYQSPANVSFGLSFSQDTYKGFGLGSYVGVGMRVGGFGNVNASVGVSVANDGYGGTSVGISVGASLGSGAAQGLSLGGSVGLSTNFESVNANAGAGVSARSDKGAYQSSLLGVSISSGSGKPSFSVGGGTASVQNSKAGRIQTQSSGFSVDVPVLPYVSVSLGYNYQRYWSDEEQSTYTNGALYYPAAYAGYVVAGKSYYDDHAFDTYRLPDPYTENAIDNPDPDYIQGGTFPDYDNYFVTAQGLSGSMRPYAFQHGLVSQTKRAPNQTVTIESAKIPIANFSLGFRFTNDFSNKYLQTPGGWRDGADGITYPFDQNPVFGNNDRNYGYTRANHLAGSKHIEWFTNQSITSGRAALQGFIETSSPGFVRFDQGIMASQIGGFMITNESGVTYHYALPAYSGNEHVYTEAVDHSNGLTYNHLSKPNPYAYTWFLTAVTGPDYVDRGSAGLDESDWGYWVSFSYGKWSATYNWRNPSEGFHRDLDGKFQSFSTGTKELYYLNSVSTRTHTAIFEKDWRLDGKGAAEVRGRPDASNNNNAETTYRQFSRTSIAANTYSSISYFPCVQLRLNRVLLFNNKDLPKNLEQIYTASTAFDTKDMYVTPDEENPGFGQTIGYAHYGENIADVADFRDLGAAFTKKASRIITMQHDYSLTPGTTNSYDVREPDIKKNAGKLTLNSLSLAGVGGATMMPPTRFYYDIPKTSGEPVYVNEVGNGTVSDNSIGEIQLADNSAFVAGDILKISTGSAVVYATILAQNQTQLGSATYPVRYLTYPNLSAGPSYQATVTKNPPYLKEAYDSWGMFKSDFDDDLVGVPATSIIRQPTKLSNRNTDVWSLRRIVSPLGAAVEVQYEGDEYQTAVLSPSSILANVIGGYFRMGTGEGIGYISAGSFSYEQALQLFAPNQIIHVAGLTGEVAEKFGDNRRNEFMQIYLCRNNALRYIDDIELKILSVGRRGQGQAFLTVQLVNGARVGRVFYTVLNAFMGIATGYIKSIGQSASEPNYGGGIRVAAVAVVDGKKSHTTKYNYASSGTTSFEPAVAYSINNAEFDSYKNGYRNCSRAMSGLNTYKESYLKQMPMLLAVAREMVPPGVMYGQVTVSESVTDEGKTFADLGSVAYQFEVFDRSMLGIVGAPYVNLNRQLSTANREVRVRNMAIKNMTSRLGNLKRVTHYDAQGKMLTETINHYASDDIAPAYTGYNDSPDPIGYIARTADNYEQKLAAYNSQGLIKESYGDFRRVLRDDGRYDLKGVISQRESYPNIQTGSTTTDYRTGIRTSSQTLAFDFYSGAATQTLTVDGYGNRFMSVATPAYRRYPALGPTSADIRRKNMLTQLASTTVYKVDEANKPLRVLSATAQTWSDQVPVVGTVSDNPEQAGTQPGIWRPWQSYSWLPTGTTNDGLTPLTGSDRFVGYDFRAPSQPVPWKLTSQVTLYNPYSNALEAKDINGVFLATKMGFNQSKVLVSGGPAAYPELAYSGAEEARAAGEYFSGGVAVTWDPSNTLPAGGSPVGTGDVERSTLKAHTGQASLRIGTRKHGFSYSLNADATDPTKFHVDPQKAYRVSVWTDDPAGQLYYWVDGAYSPMVGGTAQQRTADGWYLVELLVPPLGNHHTTLRVGCYNSKPADGSGQSQSVYFDDFRVQPINAQVSSYVYAPLTGQVTDILDNNNLYTHYDYTADGRLRRVSRETFRYGAKKLAEHSYHLANILDAATLEADNDGATISLPETDEPIIITYDTGDGKGYRPLNATARPYTFGFSAWPPARWVKVRLQDSKGRVRELVKTLY